MQDKVQSYETLYRAVKRSKPNWLDQNREPTSAMFKDKNGNSVDRDAGRELDEIIEFMNNGALNGRVKGAVSLNAGACMAEPIPVKVESAPSEGNPYHANIFLDKNDEFLADIQALKLADLSTVVYFDESMEWTAC